MIPPSLPPGDVAGRPPGETGFHSHLNENRSGYGAASGRHVLLIQSPLLPLVLGLLPLAAGCAADSVEMRREAWLMGTSFVARVAAEDREAALEASEAAFDEVARLESLISSWDSTTAIGRLNRAPIGQAMGVDPELLDLLLLADSLAAATGRAFEPAVGPLVDAWDLRGPGRRPSQLEIERALEAVGAGFRLDRAGRTATRLHEDAWIDTGGFGKGAALALAGAAVRHAGARGALLDFGGQALAVGERAGGGPWRIGVAHPERRDELVLELRMGEGLSVATSGGSERPGHLLDPRTGERLPAWGSVTVVSPDPVVADALATALFVMGPEGALRWAAERDHPGVLVLESPPRGREGAPRARWNRAMARWLDTPPTGSGRPPSGTPQPRPGGTDPNPHSPEGSPSS